MKTNEKKNIFSGDKRIRIFTGHYGSGKTEVSVNYAMQMAALGKKTAIVDLDIVNPYFRTVDALNELQSQGIRTVVPVFANTNVDVPALPGEINSLFENDSYSVIFDVGGDPEGARALSRYRQDIYEAGYEMLMVVNVFRKETETVEKIGEMIKGIETTSRLKVTGLVNNSNLLGLSESSHVNRGYNLVSEAAELYGIRFAFTSTVYGDPSGDVLIMKRMIKQPWE